MTKDPTTHPPEHLADPPEADDEPTGFPVLMVYSTTRLSTKGGWTNTTRICTPDGRNTLSARQNAGGSLEVGIRKATKWLSDALDLADAELVDEEPFG